MLNQQKNKRVTGQFPKRHFQRFWLLTCGVPEATEIMSVLILQCDPSIRSSADPPLTAPLPHTTVDARPITMDDIVMDTEDNNVSRISDGALSRRNAR